MQKVALLNSTTDSLK